VSAAATEQLARDGVYDLFGYTAGDVREAFVRGLAVVSRRVTRTDATVS
jgi:hypothetical protein